MSIVVFLVLFLFDLSSLAEQYWTFPKELCLHLTYLVRKISQSAHAYSGPYMQHAEIVSTCIYL